MKAYPLQKGILAFRNQPDGFLMGLTSNTLDAPQNAFLDVQGRIVAICDQLWKSPDEIWMVLEKPFVERLKQHLKKYLEFSSVILEEIEGYFVTHDLEDEHVLEENEFRIPQKKGSLILTRKAYPASVDEPAYRWFRLQHHLPVQGIDYDQEMFWNLGDPALVSLTKGCFLGQEIVARVHWRGKAPKRLGVCEIPEDSPLGTVFTSVARDPKTGKRRGFCFVPQED